MHITKLSFGTFTLFSVANEGMRGMEMKILMRMMVLCLWVLLAVFPATSYAAEQRCQELGADCVCSNTLDTPSWVNATQNFWYESNEPAGRCGGITYGGRKMNWIPTGPKVAPETGMPAGNTVTNVLRITSTAGAGIKLLENISSKTGRICARHYVRLSSDYESTWDNLCTNDKQIQIGDYFTANRSQYRTSNGGGFSPPVSPYTCRDKWCRLELCMDNIQNPTDFEIYHQNVTDGTPEVSATIPVRLAKGGPSGPYHDGMAWVINGYRQDFCAGYREFSHAMVAVWPTSAGQRIGPAPEIEGGGVSPPVDTKPPASPQGLKIK